MKTLNEITRVYHKERNRIFWILPSLKKDQFLVVIEDKDGVSTTWRRVDVVREIIKNGDSVLGYMKSELG